MRQPLALRSSSTMRNIFPDKPSSRTSNFMTGTSERKQIPRFARNDKARMKSWNAVQLCAAAFLLPARGLAGIQGRRGKTRTSVPLVCLPDGSGDGGRVGGSDVACLHRRWRHSRARATKYFVEPLRVAFAAQTIALGANA